MPVPDYQTLMAPTLRALGDGEPRSASQVREIVAVDVGINEDDQLEVVKSGVPVFDSRVGWALTYMSQARLLRRPKRGVNQITGRGQAVLRDHPERIDNHVLQTYEEFRKFKSRARKVKPDDAADKGTEVAIPSNSAGTATPRETITDAVEENNAAVAADLLVRVREQEPVFLEHLVLRVLTAMGYGGAAGSAEQLGRSGDEGLDGVIKQDPLGLDRIYVQAKRYAADRAVGRPDIQGFVGALHGAQADRGVFITTSRFSQDAYDYAEKVAARVILIDGATLAGLLVGHNIGAQDAESFVLKRLDEDFFEQS
jgi:restriction system protein